MLTKGNRTVLSIGLFFTLFTLYAQTEHLPLIPELSSRNVLFKQFTQEVENSYKLIARSSEPVEPLFFLYNALPSDTLLSVSARCSLPYETIATLNRIPGNDTKLGGTLLILPTCPGLFLPSEPKAALEILLAEKYLAGSEYSWYTFEGVTFHFIQNARLSSTERAFFLDSALLLPLPNGILTSNYGLRKSPITGRSLFHDGVDFAAPEGSPVIACKSGSVEKTGYSEVYGNFIIIKHDEATRSFYAHLSLISVEAGDMMYAREKIGKVGSTGLSTGPHLHFEIWINGKTVDPLSIIKG